MRGYQDTSQLGQKYANTCSSLFVVHFLLISLDGKLSTSTPGMLGTCSNEARLTLNPRARCIRFWRVEVRMGKFSAHS